MLPIDIYCRIIRIIQILIIIISWLDSHIITWEYIEYVCNKKIQPYKINYVLDILPSFLYINNENIHFKKKKSNRSLTQINTSCVIYKYIKKLKNIFFICIYLLFWTYFHLAYFTLIYVKFLLDIDFQFKLFLKGLF